MAAAGPGVHLPGGRCGGDAVSLRGLVACKNTPPNPTARTNQATSDSPSPPLPPPKQVSQLLTLGIGWFVYETWWGLALNLLAAVATAQVATRDIWGLSPDYQRNRVHMVGFIGCVVLCYWAPMGVQGARDAAAWARVSLDGAGAAAAAAPPPLAAAGYAAATFAALLAAGAVFAAGFPERAFPGAFDVTLFSHPLMHVGAMAAHAFEFGFVMAMWSRRAGEAAALAA